MGSAVGVWRIRPGSSASPIGRSRAKEPGQISSSAAHSVSSFSSLIHSAPTLLNSPRCPNVRKKKTTRDRKSRRCRVCWFQDGAELTATAQLSTCSSVRMASDGQCDACEGAHADLRPRSDHPPPRGPKQHLHPPRVPPCPSHPSHHLSFLVVCQMGSRDSLRVCTLAISCG